MKLLEYQAKELFNKYGLRVQKSIILTDAGEAEKQVESAGLTYPLVIKAQIPSGGRGKAGGIRFADNPVALRETVGALLHTNLKGYEVKKLMVAEKADIIGEWYLSIVLDRDAKSPRLVFSTLGGVDIEETAKRNPAAIAGLPINPLLGVTEYAIRYIMSKCGADVCYYDVLKETINKLYRLFMEYSCLLAEINPLGVECDGKLIAVDGKADIDDSALYRLPDAAAFRDDLDEYPLAREARARGFLYIPMDKNGRVAAMSNGSGMLMSMIDLLKQNGVSPACGFDLGGGATKDRISEAVKIVMSTPGADTLFVSIFGGITRCDEVAGGLNEAFSHIKAGYSARKTAIVRMEGTNKDKGIEILNATPGVIIVNSLAEGVEAIATDELSAGRHKL